MVVEWETPVYILCDVFILNYTIISNIKESFTIGVRTKKAIIEMIVEAKAVVSTSTSFIGTSIGTSSKKNLVAKDAVYGTRRACLPHQFDVYCLFNGLISNWKAHRVVDFRKPLKIDKLHAVVGKNSLALYWQYDADNYLRLSYLAIYPEARIISTVELRGKNRYKFNNMQHGTYIFMIIVLKYVDDIELQSDIESITVSVGSTKRFTSVEKYNGERIFVTFESSSDNSVSVNGFIDNYAIIVTEQIQDVDYKLDSWFDVQKKDIWTPYRATSSTYNPFRQKEIYTATFIIGDDNCFTKFDKTEMKPENMYCNGKLRRNRQYFVKLRTYSLLKIAVESDWVSVNNTYRTNEHKKWNKQG
ncbi:unnamed protein product [Dracunculus medinensis]|uniref:PTP_tm domain-containing protein n=1 Tax=Dracunculus medinensis TaxID=318479 RepID=A0A158Q6E4_DRAME|nr:unnamed protein product [Dracunculus medinensis]